MPVYKRGRRRRHRGSFYSPFFNIWEDVRDFIDGVVWQRNKYYKPSKRASSDAYERKLKTAYRLWAVAGIWGAHRYYLGYTLSGILYSFTFGFGLIGWFIDYFRLPQLVAASFLPSIPSTKQSTSYASGSSSKAVGDIESEVIKLAEKEGPILSPTKVSAKLGIPVSKALEVLENLVKLGYARYVISEDGTKYYRILGIEMPRGNYEEI